MKTLHEYSQQNEQFYSFIKESQPLKFSPPKMAKISDLWIWEKILERSEMAGGKHSSSQYIGNIRDGIICNDDGYVRLRNSEPIEEFGIGVKPIGKIRYEFGKFISLVEKWAGDNYYHWITTSLAKMYFFQKMESLSGYSFVVNSLKNNFVKESLAKFNIIDNVIELNGGYLCCQDVVVSSKIKDWDVDALKYIRNTLRKGNGCSRRVYISRSTTRKIINEDEVYGVLKKSGFEFVRCEKLSFDEQVNIFSDAEVIIGPHGAGMTNALFAKDGAKVLEIRNKTYHGTCYFFICNNLGFDYYNLYGKGHDVRSLDEVSSDLHGNIQVDIMDLEATLDLMKV